MEEKTQADEGNKLKKTQGSDGEKLKKTHAKKWGLKKRHMLELALRKRRAQDTIQKSTLKSNVKSDG